MNNEQNKPTELTEKELEGISGGMPAWHIESDVGRTIKTGMIGEEELVGEMTNTQLFLS